MIFPQNRRQSFPRGIVHAAQRQPAIADLHAHQIHGFLNGDGIDVGKQGIGQLQLLKLQIPASLHLSLIHIFFWQGVKLMAAQRNIYNSFIYYSIVYAMIIFRFHQEG